jgi:hypothetical protein
LRKSSNLISSGFLHSKKENLLIHKFPLLAHKKGLIHGISTRHGGVSRAVYRSLNLSFKVGDDPKNVKENRRRLAKASNLEEVSFVQAEQVHKAEVAILDDLTPDCEAERLPTVIPGVDALITKTCGPVPLLLGADCPLILLYDEATPAIALIHASWRSLLGEIILNTLQVWEAAFGSLPEKILAGISPSIGPCCYEVKEDFVQAWEKSDFCASEFFIHRQDRLFFDLWAATQAQLLSAGILPQNIYNPRVCTACNYEEFFSYRRSGGVTGRFGLFAALTE